MRVSPPNVLALPLPEADPVDFVIDGEGARREKPFALGAPAVARREDLVVEDDVVRVVEARHAG